MNIAIIGGGFTGLTAAYKLSKAGHNVTVFEKEKHLGGLAIGFKEKHWSWHLEAAYHHLFTNDTAIIGLIAELGLADKLIIKRPITSTLWRGRMHQLDSPLHLLTFPGLSYVDKIRTGIALGFLKIFPFWRILENITAEHFLISIGGVKAWETIWKSLLYGKFSDLAPTVSAAWFWARIVKRTSRLYYIRGGFHTLVTALSEAINKNGGIIKTGVSLTKIPEGFDKILFTVPSPIATKLVPKLHVPAIPHLHAQTLIVETDKPILKDVYWLNVTDQSFPFLAAVAHTNFMDSSHYGGRHLTYFGNYLPPEHPYISMNANQLCKIFLPFIRRLSPNLKFEILNVKLFVGPFAQPVHQLHYSQKIPPIQTAIPNIYLANMDFVFPWDRGTNYAVALGIKAANVILSSK